MSLCIVRWRKNIVESWNIKPHGQRLTPCFWSRRFSKSVLFNWPNNSSCVRNIAPMRCESLDGLELEEGGLISSFGFTLFSGFLQANKWLGPTCLCTIAMSGSMNAAGHFLQSVASWSASNTLNNSCFVKHPSSVLSSSFLASLFCSSLDPFAVFFSDLISAKRKSNTCLSISQLHDYIVRNDTILQHMQLKYGMLNAWMCTMGKQDINFQHDYRPRSEGDTVLGSVHPSVRPFVCVCVCVSLSVCPSSPAWTIWPLTLIFGMEVDLDLG